MLHQFEQREVPLVGISEDRSRFWEFPQIAMDPSGNHYRFLAAMAYGDPTTTNNQDEYTGLITGLTCVPLSVIGDSMLIIRQRRTYTPPLNDTLKDKYAHARRLADSLGIRTWSHHARAANKMADAATNLALDTTNSSQTHYPAGHERHQHIVALLP